jgi:hypothetical protein
MAEIPARKDWVVFKKKYGVSDGASKKVKLGEVLDQYYHAPATTYKEQGALLDTLETKLHEYITTIDKKKVKKYSEFEKAYLNDYLGVAHTKKEDVKRYTATAAVYKTELTKFFTAVQALSPKMNAKGVDTAHKKDELEKFKSGPVRGVSALGKSVKNVDVREIDKWLGTINTGVQALPKTPTDAEIQQFIETTLKTAEEIRKEAVKLGLFGDHVEIKK